MTTIIGLKTQKDGENVVLASDISSTNSSWDARGDVAYRKQTKQECQKIFVDKKGELAVGMSGVFDVPYINFLHSLIEGEIDFRKAISQNGFSELLQLNLQRWGGKVPNPENINALVIATRFDNKPKLYDCWPLGRVEELPYSGIGSGAEYALRNIFEKQFNMPPYLTLEEGIDLSIESLDKASRDIYTGGIDIVVVTPEKIHSFGERINDRIREAKSRAVYDIKQDLSKKP